LCWAEASFEILYIPQKSQRSKKIYGQSALFGISLSLSPLLSLPFSLPLPLPSSYVEDFDC